MPEDIKSQKPEGAADFNHPDRSSALQQSPPESKLPVKGMVITLVCIVLVATGVYFFGQHQSTAPDGRGSKMKASVPVTVALATTETVPIEIRTTGNILPYSVVSIVPQVNGQLSKVYFTQGQTVKAGDLLFLINPAPYKASLDQALGNVAKDKANIQAAIANTARDQATISQYRANLQKDQASLKYAQVEANRYKSLVQQGAISQEQADQTLTSDATATAQIEADKKQIENGIAVVNSDKAQIETAKGTLEADEAVAANAKIQLDWCTIHAPIDGRTGSLQVYEGNVVVANNATPLVTIAQVQPIYVQFTIPEEYLTAVRRCLANNTLTIRAMIEGMATDHVAGTASFLENTVNTTSGTALLRATFRNSKLRLYPGQFVDVSVSMPPDAPSVVVPVSAIQTTQKGNAVYVVGPDKTVQLVQVELARTSDDWAAISSGVNAGDTVVTDGQLQLTPGVSVSIVAADGSGKQGGKQGSKHGSGTNPDAAFNPAAGDSSAGSDAGQSNSFSSDSSQSTPARGTGQNSSPVGNPAIQSNSSGNSGAQNSAGPRELFNPAGGTGAPYRAPEGAAPASTAGGAAQGGGFTGLGSRKHDSGIGGAWHHGH